MSVEIQADVKEWVEKASYKEGFYTQLNVDKIAKGLNEQVVRLISAKRNEPEWMLAFRLKAFEIWQQMPEPHWLKADYTPLDYQQYSYYSAPQCGSCNTNDEEDSVVGKEASFLTGDVEAAFDLLGVPTRENDNGIAVDAIFDSVSVATTYRDELQELGIIFCSFSEAIHQYPELVQQYLGSVVPPEDNFFCRVKCRRRL